MSDRDFEEIILSVSVTKIEDGLARIVRTRSSGWDTRPMETSDPKFQRFLEAVHGLFDMVESQGDVSG